LKPIISTSISWVQIRFTVFPGLSGLDRLARHRSELFRHEDFAMLYCRDNGHNIVPPSLLATALQLQAYDRVSDAENKTLLKHTRNNSNNLGKY